MQHFSPITQQTCRLFCIEYLALYAWRRSCGTKTMLIVMIKCTQRLFQLYLFSNILIPHLYLSVQLCLLWVTNYALGSWKPFGNVAHMLFFSSHPAVTQSKYSCSYCTILPAHHYEKNSAMYVSASSVWNVHVCLVECVIVESPVKDVKGWEQGLNFAQLYYIW